MIRLIKFGLPSNTKEPIPHDWGNVFFRERMSDGNDRLKIGVSENQTALIRELSSVLEAPFGLLYVSIVPQGSASRGRFQAPDAFSRESLDDFLERYGTAFDQDGRHALWIHSPDGQLVFTPHDIIYAYGPLERFLEILAGAGFRAGGVAIPCPHVHRYHHQFDEVVTDLLDSREWQMFPLADIDDET